MEKASLRFRKGKKGLRKEMAFVNVKALATTPDNLSLILGSQWDQKRGEMTLESCLLISISIYGIRHMHVCATHKI